MDKKWLSLFTLFSIVLLLISSGIWYWKSWKQKNQTTELPNQQQDAEKMATPGESTINKIKNAPWEYNNKTVTINIQRIISSSPPSTKSSYAICENSQEMLYVISDLSDEADLCANKDVRLDAPRQIIAKVFSKTLCKKQDFSRPVQIVVCKEYYPLDLKEPQYWSVRLQYIK